LNSCLQSFDLEEEYVSEDQLFGVSSANVMGYVFGLHFINYLFGQVLFGQEQIKALQDQIVDFIPDLFKQGSLQSYA
jgi:hypothetical protein